MVHFDLCHFGHYNFLKVCAELGDVIVGVNSDAFVQRYKGTPPILNERERKTTIKLWGYKAHINPSEGREMIEVTKPDILAVGSDWARKNYLKQINVAQDELDEWGVALVYIPYTKGISSTEIKNRVKCDNNCS